MHPARTTLVWFCVAEVHHSTVSTPAAEGSSAAKLHQI